MKKIQPRIIKNNEASESNLREFYKKVIQFVVKTNSLNTSNSKLSIAYLAIKVIY